MNKFMLGCVAVLFAVSVIAGISQESSADSSMGAMVQQTCTQCHGSDRICQRLGNDEEFWVSTIKRMQSYGADVSFQQIPELATFMVGATTDTASFCNK